MPKLGKVPLEKVAAAAATTERLLSLEFRMMDENSLDCHAVSKYNGNEVAETRAAYYRCE